MRHPPSYEENTFSIIVPFFVENSKGRCNNIVMLKLINIVDNKEMLSGETAQSIKSTLSSLSLDGVEAIRCGERSPALQNEDIKGVHLVFWSDWVDFWRGNKKALLQKFGTMEAAEGYYGCSTPEGLLDAFRADLAYAQEVGAEYVVFHVSDVSPEETLRYSRFHTDEEVIDASAELLNILFDGKEYPFMLLMENLWWPGFTMTDPRMTERLLSKVAYKNTGILLDTGHLFGASPSCRDTGACIAFAKKMIENHGSLAACIRGMHLHGTATGHVVSRLMQTPPALAPDFAGRFQQAYEWVLQIDPHCPLTHPDVSRLVERISPEYLTLELAGCGLSSRRAAIEAQLHALAAK